jgi:hypothetical protein
MEYGYSDPKGHNDECIEIQRRLKLPNKAYLLLLAVMRFKDIHKKTKVNAL